MNRRNPFLILIVVVAIAATIYYFWTSDRSGNLVMIGIVDANQVIVSPKISGRIEKLTVEEGSDVKQGDLIAILDSAELQAEQKADQANLSSVLSKVSETQATQTMTQGEVGSGVVNARARVQSAQSQLDEARADLTRLRSDEQRMSALTRQGIVAQQEQDRLLAQVQAQQARVTALADQVKVAQADISTALARTHQAQAAQSTVAATRAQAASSRAQLEQMQARLDYTRVVAPVSGTVSVRVARQGEVVSAGSPIVTIVDLSDTWVRAAIPETYSDRIALGDEYDIRLPSGRAIKGKVIFKAVEADFATQRDVSRSKRDIRTFVLKLKVDNSERKLAPGMTAEVLIPRASYEKGRAAATEAPR